MAAEEPIRLPGAHDSERFDRLACELLTAQLEAGLAELAPGSEGSAPGAITDWRRFRPCPVDRRRGAATRDLPALGRALAEHLAPRLAAPLLALEDGSSESLCAALLAAARAAGSEALALPVGRGSRARSWLAARQRSGSAATILAPARSWSALVVYLERRRLRFRLPAAATLVWCGDLRAWREAETLASDAARHLGLEPHAIDLLVDIGTCVSPLLVGPTSSERCWRVRALPWTAIEIVDPAGRSARVGRLAILDLATRDQPAYQRTGIEASQADDGVAVGFPPSVPSEADHDPHK